MKRVIYAGALALAALTAPMKSDAATLVGTGTFGTTDDLTIVDTGSSVLEFLDLTVTQGVGTITDALNAVGGGFAWATAAQVNELLDAFGLPLLPVDATTYSADTAAASSASVAAFQSTVGATFSIFSIGVLDDGVADGETALINVRGGSSSDIFRNHTNFGAGDNGTSNVNHGYFLVREVAPIPLPAAGFGLLAGLGMLAGLRARKKA